MKIEEKKAIIDDIHEKFLKSKIAILTDYKGLNVATLNILRRRLRENQIEFKVVKNTFLSRASEDTKFVAIKEYLKGASAIALSYNDPVAPAKILTQFANENDKLEIKVGVMNGQVYDLAAIKKLSDLPSREVLLAQLLSAMNAVPTGLVRALNNIPGGFVNVLQAIKEKKEKISEA